MSQSNPEKSKSQATREWLKYSGMAFQMIFTLLAGWYIGAWIDGKVQMGKPLFAIGLSFLFLIAFFYKLIRQLSNDK